MIYKLYGVRDRKLARFVNVYCQENADQAIRNFKGSCLQEGSPYGEFPEDFSLSEFGEFHSPTGLMKLHEVPVEISHALDHVKKASVDSQLASRRVKKVAETRPQN